jgi:hypothetical protein
MVNKAQNPVTDNVGTGADSQNQAGKWYQVVYTRFEFGDPFLSKMEWCDKEIVFIPSGQSLAKHVRKYVKEHSVEGFPFSRDRSQRWQLQDIDSEFVRKCIHGAMVCLVEEITLLTSDGQKISGFKPKSIVNLFKDYVKPVKYTEQHLDEFDDE